MGICTNELSQPWAIYIIPLTSFANGASIGSSGDPLLTMVLFSRGDPLLTMVLVIILLLLGQPLRESWNNSANNIVPWFVLVTSNSNLSGSIPIHLKPGFRPV